MLLRSDLTGSGKCNTRTPSTTTSLRSTPWGCVSSLIIRASCQPDLACLTSVIGLQPQVIDPRHVGHGPFGILGMCRRSVMAPRLDVVSAGSSMVVVATASGSESMARVGASAWRGPGSRASLRLRRPRGERWGYLPLVVEANGSPHSCHVSVRSRLSAQIAAPAPSGSHLRQNCSRAMHLRTMKSRLRCHGGVQP